MPTAERLDKLSKLIALFDDFHQALSVLDDATARELVANWTDVRNRYVEPSGVPRSALASGMEQGLRETPMLMHSMNSEARKRANQALASATMAHYPDFLAKTAGRIAKVKARGSIRGEGEFHLIRHQADLIEGMPGQTMELQQIYALLDAYEARLG
ncbi:MAG: hypothetical protein J7598_00670 [Mitsuaria chitosanitabida]|uniref:hypothetical protein n=1 Tax=Roseateles chitosanitabidus TaxID=65048 RepID=UPI001B14560C|nr:hypothetical protein [Roseateles chitosanitabidus]MBO9685098.1 hypothetical protein [Roseateles chitosanitabidus]